MIEINLLAPAEAREACAAANLPFGDGSLVYRAVDGLTPLGICAFTAGAEEGRLDGVAMQGEGLLPIADGLVRSALSLLWQRGVETVTCAGGLDRRLLLGTGFKEADGGWILELKTSFFAGCGGCGGKK